MTSSEVDGELARLDMLWADVQATHEMGLTSNADFYGAQLRIASQMRAVMKQEDET